jgi:hypothetical protein
MGAEVAMQNARFCAWSVPLVLVGLCACGGKGDEAAVDESPSETGGSAGATVPASTGGSREAGAGGAREAGAAGTTAKAGSTGAGGATTGAGGATTGAGGQESGGTGGTTSPLGEAGPKGAGSIVCDGTSAGVTIPSAADLEILGDWTLEMWLIDEETFCHTWRFLLKKGDEYNDVYFAATEDCGIRLGHKVNWNYQCQLTDLSGYGTKWLHYAATYRSSDHMGQIYINGEPRFDPMLPLDLTPEAKGQPVTLCDLFKGKLDDVRIWNVVRTPEQIKATYQTELADVPSGLVANWTFEDTGGTVVHDRTGHGHDGTLHASAKFSTDVHP